MADNEISITVSNRSQNIDVNTGGGNTQIGVSGDNSQYFSNEARKSAERAAQSATEAEQSATNAQTVYEDLQEFAGQSLADVSDAKTEAIDAIGVASREFLEDEDFVTVATNIADIKTSAVNIEDINTVAENIDDIADASLLANEFVEIWEAGVADVNLSNITEEGQAKFDVKANVADVLNKSQITNCLLEVPQRIKLELNNGVLTLKAGSEVLKPNGFEADGVTPKFDYVTLTEDTSMSTGWGNQKFFIYINGNKRIFARELSYAESGDSSKLTTQYRAWYDTANNKVKMTDDTGSTWNEGYSLPCALVTFSSSVIVSIDEVFNGVGVMDSTAWLNKDAKMLSADGRNGDETLKNLEYTTENIIMTTFDNNVTDATIIFGINEQKFYSAKVKYFSKFADIPSNYVGNFYAEDINRNGWYQNGNVSIAPRVYLGTFTTTNGVISNFRPSTTFHAADFNDFIELKNNALTTSNKSAISGWGMPSGNSISLTIGQDASTYTAPANGWFYMQAAFSSNGIVGFANQTTWKTSIRIYQHANYEVALYIPVRKNDVVSIAYSGSVRLESWMHGLNFVYAEGEV